MTALQVSTQSSTHLPSRASALPPTLQGAAAWRHAGAAEAAPDPRQALTAASLASVFDELDTGVLVCDARAQVLLSNEAARRELAEGGVLELAADGSLGVRGGAGLLALRRAVHNAALDRRHQLVPLRAGEHSLMVSAQPLRALPGALPCAVLLLGRRKLCPDLAVQELGRLFELTSAERDVLASLLAGARVGALAQARGVAVSTVRTQVAALRAKLGVHRVDDLTRLVAELPPMMSALRCRSPLGSGGGGGAAGAGALQR